jgi:bacterioferritin (cytochrome b1)
MKAQETIKALNHALRCEYAGIIQYLQSAQLVQGNEREVHDSFFKKMSKECWDHAHRVGRWLVVLNSVPSVEPGPIRQSADLTEMLRYGYELEREAEAAYLEAHAGAGENAALRFFLEEMVQDEHLHIDEFEMLLGTKKLAGAATREAKAKS